MLLRHGAPSEEVLVVSLFLCAVFIFMASVEIDHTQRPKHSTPEGLHILFV